MMAWSDTYRQMTRMLMSAAAEHCNGRIVMTHEGGYSAAYVPFIGLAVVEELSGILTDVDDPYGFICEHGGQQDLQPHQDALIRDAEVLLGRVGGPA